MTLSLARAGMRRASYLYLGVGLMQACYLPYTAIVFHSRGVGVESIGLISAMNAIIALTAAPIWGHLGDATLGRAAAFRLSLVLSATGVLLFAFGPLDGIPGATMSAFAGAGIVPLLDAIGMERLAATGGQWGPLRALTSGSYATACIASGAVVAAAGIGAIGPLYAGGALIILLGTIGLRTNAPLNLHAAAEQELQRSELAGGNAEIAVVGSWRDRFGTASITFRRSPRLAPFLLLSLFMNLGAGAFYAYGTIRMQDLGGTESMVALSSSVSAAVEIPFFIAGAVVVTRLGLRTLYIFGLLGLAACTLAYAVIPSPELLITARGLCGVGFSSTLLASVMAVRSMVPLELQATGQALLGAISFGLAVSIASLVGGVIYAQLGAETLFYLATLILLSAIPFATRILRNI